MTTPADNSVPSHTPEMSPRDIATELALFLQENHGASFDGIGYSNTSAGFTLTLSGRSYDVNVAELEVEPEP